MDEGHEDQRRKKSHKDVKHVKSEGHVRKSNHHGRKSKSKHMSLPSIPDQPAPPPTRATSARPSTRPLTRPSTRPSTRNLGSTIGDSAGRDSIVPRKTSENDFALRFCKLLADDFWESAWEICAERFVAANAPQMVACDLRNTWIYIVQMQFMDTDEMHSAESINFPSYEDSVPLPPKFDTWSHGALEPLPRTCRESIMDPFLREPLPWLLEKMAEENEDFPVDSEQPSVLHVPSKEQKSQSIDRLGTQVTRPPCAVPASAEESENEEEDTSTRWSMASTQGSLISMSGIEEELKFKGLESGSKDRMGSLGSQTDNTWKNSSKASVELLYPTKYPPAEIKGSSEIAYKWAHNYPGFSRSNSVSGGGGRRDSKGLKKGSEIIAFKLPQQTSSEARKEFQERKAKKLTSSAKLNSSTSQSRFK